MGDKTDNKQNKELLGELMLREKLITPEKLNDALNRKRKFGGRIGENLVAIGAIDEWALITFLSRQSGLPSINLQETPPPAESMQLVSKELIQKYQFLPITKLGNKLIIVTGDPQNIQMLDDIKFSANVTEVDMFITSASAIKAEIDKFFNLGADAYQKIISTIDPKDLEIIPDENLESDDADLQDDSASDPVVQLVNLMLTMAVQQRASDIHIEPTADSLRVRFRIDSILHKKLEPPRQFKNGIASRLKILANLNIAEKRKPQDGHFKIKFQSKDIEFRVAIVPTIHGEKITLRVMDKSNVLLELNQLGFEENTLRIFRESLKLPNGIVLITGPTGSGKTTTLYAALNELNTESVHIITAEDPVEMSLNGINQVQINPAVDLNFAACLREFLRQDPNIILVGEIRDYETAETAFKAALTGHLVLSTLHTNDAPSTILRLSDMGIEPFMINAGVRLVIAQRLVRLLCLNCREETKFDAETLINLGLDEDQVKTAKIFKNIGCYSCNHTGFKGRKAIYEAMPITEEIQELISSSAPASEIRSIAKQQGMATLRQSALAKLHQGLTTIEEVIRLT